MAARLGAARSAESSRVAQQRQLLPGPATSPLWVGKTLCANKVFRMNCCSFLRGMGWDGEQPSFTALR